MLAMADLAVIETDGRSRTRLEYIAIRQYVVEAVQPALIYRTSILDNQALHIRATASLICDFD